MIEAWAPLVAARLKPGERPPTFPQKGYNNFFLYILVEQHRKLKITRDISLPFIHCWPTHFLNNRRLIVNTPIISLL